MVFSSPVFLFLFLPVALALHTVSPRWFRNVTLLAMSLLFYAWGEPRLIAIMLISIGMNYVLGLVVERVRDRKIAPWVLAFAVVANLAMLAHFKYSGFLAGSLNDMLVPLGWPPLRWNIKALPIGISFYTFQAMSYVIDVYRRETPAQRNPLDLALYIALFPQLIAGPIVRYVDVAAQLRERTVTRAGFICGIQRFVLGLGKKMLLANSAATVADAAFDIPDGQLAMSVAWLGILCYSLQIYFDFSGYSDMAIGLGHMFGFNFLENFNYPYVSRSVTEFWRRWHISLSTWYRDYLYIPLGGSRCSPWRVTMNLLIVFLLCGLWHGASWNFVVWGLFHGTFLVLERQGLSTWLERCPAVLRHTYAMLVVMVGWVLFKANTLSHAGVYLQALAGFGGDASLEFPLSMYLDQGLALVLIVGCIGCLPVLPWLEGRFNQLLDHWQAGPVRIAVLDSCLALGRVSALTLVLLASASMMLSATYNPFIYFRF